MRAGLVFRASGALCSKFTRYMEKARELADSYPRLLEKRRELKKQIDESAAWLYTRDEVIYKLSQGAHEQGERVKTSGTSNPVERTVLNCDKVMASMNREILEQRDAERSRQDLCANLFAGSG